MFDYSAVETPDNNSIDLVLNSIERAINKIVDEDNESGRNLGIFWTPYIHLYYDRLTPAIRYTTDKPVSFEWFHYQIAQFYSVLYSLNIPVVLNGNANAGYNVEGKLIHVPAYPGHMESFANYIALHINCVGNPIIVIEMNNIHSTRSFCNHVPLKSKEDLQECYDALCELEGHLIKLDLEENLSDIQVLMRPFNKFEYSQRRRLPIRDAIKFLDTLIPSVPDDWQDDIWGD